ncbi:hypothetical protein [Mycolicibacterium sp. 624]|uniref:hypothetical protein n=1 Tax=Mycolicibacterium sp. 624 TaxID=3156314 RepID=UPI003395E246
MIQGAVIETTVTKWVIAVLGVAIIVAGIALPWFHAAGVNGSADMAGWGAWTRTGEVDASLRPLPLALLVLIPAAVMIWGALRESFGIAVIGSMATFAGGLMPFMLMPVADRRAPGRDAVGIAVASGPQVVVAIAVVVTTICWIGYARCVLRPAPRAES